MARAVQQLQTLKTGEAIPHEMAALNALLQAQAEIRQRQLVQSQNTGGSYGGGRSGQDLSNLFDRELKRQSKTNYENKAQVESTPETEKGQSALDKIRDLARRQEELTRQQRDLARSGLSAEEMKRQLEKLTREQEELRRQLEEAAGSKGSDGSRGSDRSGSGGAAGSVRDLSAEARRAEADAMEQMRQSMQQLQRNDPQGAASSAQRAADDLRQTEQRLQSGSPDAQKRALGDLQLESQQIAEEQRRIANEAERLDREAGGTADARRRLAADKDRLADRVDNLRRQAEGLSRRSGDLSRRSPEGAKTDPIEGAATDLAAQKLGDKMRAGADGLRQQKPGPLAPPEQQLADALDRVSRKLNGADAGGAKGESAKLADQLDQVRDARQRLSRLEKQISDATRRQAGRADGAGKGSPELQRLQQEYNQQLQHTRDLMNRLQQGMPASGANMSTPEQHEWSRSAPGTEAFKQDYAAWQSLAKDVDRGLERYESSVAGKLASSLAQDRLRAGGSERVPDAYQKRVPKYFESLAKKKSS